MGCGAVDVEYEFDTGGRVAKLDESAKVVCLAIGVLAAGLATVGGINAGAAGALTTGSGDALAKTIGALAPAAVRKADGSVDTDEAPSGVGEPEPLAVDLVTR